LFLGGGGEHANNTQKKKRARGGKSTNNCAPKRIFSKFITPSLRGNMGLHQKNDLLDNGREKEKYRNHNGCFVGEASVATSCWGTSGKTNNKGSRESLGLVEGVGCEAR